MQWLVFFLCIISSTAFASDNPLNDYLLSLSPASQTEYLANHMSIPCYGYGAFYMGINRSEPYHPAALWSIHCNEGKSYLINVEENGTEGIMDCQLYKHDYHGRCFRASGDQ